MLLEIKNREVRKRINSGRETLGHDDGNYGDPIQMWRSGFSTWNDVAADSVAEEC